MVSPLRPQNAVLKVFGDGNVEKPPGQLIAYTFKGNSTALLTPHSEHHQVSSSGSSVLQVWHCSMI